MQHKKHTCSYCGGSGRVTCSHCGGQGGYYSGSHTGEYRADHHNYDTSYAHTLWMTCSTCSGSHSVACSHCGGSGHFDVYE